MSHRVDHGLDTIESSMEDVSTSEANATKRTHLVEELYKSSHYVVAKRNYTCSKLKLVAMILASFLAGLIACNFSALPVRFLSSTTSCNQLSILNVPSSPHLPPSEPTPRLTLRDPNITHEDFLHHNLIVLYGDSVWTKYDLWKQADWKKCPSKYRNCRITNNFHVVEDEKYKAKVIVFNAEKMPSRQDMEKANRHKGSLNVFMSGITPQRSEFRPSDFQNFFDVTMTYKEGSHIRIPYWPNDGKLPAMYRAKPKGRRVTEDERLDIEEDLHDYFLRYGKEDFMGYTIKNCSDNLFSNLFVRKLREEGLIITYGVDSTEKCLNIIKDTVPLPCRSGWDSDDCVKMFEQFKFYIVPEDDLCKDYVGKNYWYAILAWHAVPIVYGAADPAKFLIPGSYINTLEEEYISPTFKKAYSVSNDALAYYRAFHWWRHEDRLDTYYWQCELCRYITENPVAAERQVDMTSFWNAERDCGRSTQAYELMRGQLIRTGVIRGD